MDLNTTQFIGGDLEPPGENPSWRASTSHFPDEFVQHFQFQVPRVRISFVISMLLIYIMLCHSYVLSRETALSEAQG